ncbi:MAG: hypothetical protein WCR51_06395 [Planctomycetia bacterium]
MNEPASFRWLRIVAIATGAIILASCRSLTAPAVLSATVLTAAPDDADESAVLVTDEPATTDDQVRPVGLETPCPPLPRLSRRGCRGGRCNACEMCIAGPCAGGNCPTAICLPPAGVPTIGPCLVCDGGDHGAPARPAARLGLKNLTAGDTVARYRPADALLLDEDDTSEVRLVTSNCACVFAPRFSSVRELIRPHEEAVPVGPKGIANDEHVDAAIDRIPVVARTQRVGPDLARTALVGLVVEERLPVLAVDQADLPEASINAEKPVERALDVHPAVAGLVQTPRIKVGFDVPLAWTCVTGAQVIVAGQPAEVVASDQGTATLRLEEPGRSELTLCKQAGSDTARVGEELDFTIFVLNSGDRSLADIVLVDALPKRLTLVPQSAASSLPADISTGTGDDGSVVVTWRLTGSLAPGEGGFVRFRTIVR